MKKIINKITILSLVCIVFLGCIPESNAQLFNKISKGLEKVNKGLEKVNKGLDKVEKAAKGKDNKKDKNSAAHNTVSSSQSSSQISLQADYEEDDIKGSEENGDNEENILMEKIKAMGAVMPHVTSNTKFLYKKPQNSFTEIVPVSEGIFATYEIKPGDYIPYLGFYTLDGKRLTENRYKCVEGQFPIFDNGAVILQDLPNGKRNPPFIILYTDGTARRLPETYREVSQFHDGIAVVQEGMQGFCIDTKGNKVLQHLSSPTAVVLNVGPLRDGLRRVEIRYEEKSGYSSKYKVKTGFIDKEGNWAIKPVYSSADEFKNGYCWVTDLDNKEMFIDAKGNTVVDLFNREDDFVSKYISEGYFIRRNMKTLQKPTYYDLAGNAVASYDIVSDFHNGYAFVIDRDKFGGEFDVKIVNKDFQVVGSMGPYLWDHVETPFAWGGGFVITEGDSGLITLSNRYVVSKDGKLKIFIPYESWFEEPLWPSKIGDFYPGEYAPVKISFDDDEGVFYGWDGYINKHGEFEVIITDDERALRKLPGEQIGDTYKVSLNPVDTIPIGPKFIN